MTQEKGKKQKNKTPLDMTDHSTYWSRQSFADEGQPPGTLIKKGL